MVQRDTDTHIKKGDKATLTLSPFFSELILIVKTFPF